MKHGLLFFIFLISQSAFALYGNQVETANEAFVVTLHNNGKNFCAGVLISPTNVITAGHCIDAQGSQEYDSSHGLIYSPQDLIVQVGGQNIRGKSVDLSPKYFEGLNFDAEDLALIELSRTVKNVSPIKFASKNDIANKVPVTIIAKNKKVRTTILFARIYGESTVLFLDKATGACRGDSGGAVVINKNGQQLLAGILMYSGEGTCDRQTGYSYFPKARF